MIRKLYPALMAVFGLLFIASGALWLVMGPKSGELSYDITCKKSVMTVAYKAYANPAAADGQWYLCKTVFTNKGQSPVRNLQISYNIPDYVSWTTPEKYAELLPGQTLVELHYPQLPEKVARLTSPQTARLEMKISWEAGGKSREEIEKRNFDLRGVNEVEYTSMPSSEIVSWFDMFENTDLVAAMVTTDDPVVKMFAGEITKVSGGTTAGAGGGTEEVLRLMKMFYVYQVATGMRYASAKGVPEKLGDVKSLVQNIRLPRDVIMTGNGLCIELAILWAAVMEHLGVRTSLVVIPGHCFCIVWDDRGNAIPIECTGIGGAGIGGSSAFEDAYKSACQTLEKAMSEGVYKLLNVQDLQRSGIRPPELPQIDTKTVQDTLDKRLQAALGRGTDRPSDQPDAPPDRPPPDQPPPATGADFQIWTHPDGYFSFSYPEGWQTDMSTIQAIQQVADWFIYMAGDPQAGTYIEVYHWDDAQRISDALKEYDALIARLGARHDRKSQVDVTVGGCKGLKCTGESTNPNGQKTQWIAIYLQTKNGVVGLEAGSATMSYAQNRALLDKIVQTFRPK